MNEQTLTVGQRVRITYVVKAAWWPKGEVTGTVQKVFKNGKVAVAVDRLHNQSKDRKGTINFDLDDLGIIS